jgi:DNA-binding MarR family transcriptional regulator
LAAKTQSPPFGGLCHFGLEFARLSRKVKKFWLRGQPRRYRRRVVNSGDAPDLTSEIIMKLSMEVPRTPQHDLVAMTAALRGALLQRVEQGISSSGLTSYYFYLVAKRLTFAGPLTVASLAEQLRLSSQDVESNLRAMLQQGMVQQEGGTWVITDSGRNALSAANDTGEQVLNEIRNAIGASACDQLVTGMRGALAALRAA